jgi:hypothetical protein
MASEILGLFMTPDQYRLKQDELARQQAYEYAQLDPFQRAEAGLFMGGRQLGGMIGRALGGEDPQLKLISQRQQLSQGLDMTDPASVMKIAEQAAQLGDMQFATTLADYARKAQVDIATAQQKMREKTGVAAPIQVAQTRAQLLDQKAQLEGLPDSPDKARAMAMIDNTLAALTATSRQGQIPDAIEIARERAALQGLTPGTDAYNVFVDKTIESLTTKTARAQMFGVDREAKSLELYGMSFGDLDSAQRAKVNSELESDKRKVAAETRPLPGEGKQGAKDIASFRSEVIGTIKPYREAVSAADTALAAISDAIKNNNFASFDLARRQLIKASGDSQISRKDIEAAGGDPALLGGAIDVISRAFTSTPSLDTQKKIRSTINIMRKLALKKGQEELNVQKNIGRRAKFSQEDMDLIFNFPEFNAAPSKTPTEAPRTNETIPSDVGARVGGAQPPAKAPTAPKKGQKQTRTLKSGKVVTVEQE